MRLAPLFAISVAGLCLAWSSSANQIMVHGSSGHVFVTTPRHFHTFNQFGRVPHRRGALAYGYGYAPFGLYGGDYAAPEASAPAPVIVLNQQPAAPPPSAAELRPTVETTESGVTIIRGPGSRHLRY